jgi:selenoprotein W-related protein
MQRQIEYIKLIPGDSGRYEIAVNGRLVYSKLQTGRHIEPAEVLELIRREAR